MKVFDTKQHIILYNKYLLSFLRFANSDSVVEISCVDPSVAIIVISGACVVTGVSRVSIDLCIVVGGGGVVAVIVAISTVVVGSISTDVVSAVIGSVVVVFVTT